MVKGAIDINTDGSCGRIMDPDMAHSSLGPEHTMALGGSMATQIYMAPAETLPTDINVALGGGPGP